jgi:hypothetical protein
MKKFVLIVILFLINTPLANASEPDFISKTFPINIVAECVYVEDRSKSDKDFDPFKENFSWKVNRWGDSSPADPIEYNSFFEWHAKSQTLNIKGEMSTPLEKGSLTLLHIQLNHSTSKEKASGKPINIVNVKYSFARAIKNTKNKEFRSIAFFITENNKIAMDHGYIIDSLTQIDKYGFVTILHYTKYRCVFSKETFLSIATAYPEP